MRNESYWPKAIGEIILACSEKPWKWCCGKHGAGADMRNSIYGKVTPQFIDAHPDLPWCKECVKQIGGSVERCRGLPLNKMLVRRDALTKYEGLDKLTLREAYSVLPKDVWDYDLVSLIAPKDIVIANPNDPWIPAKVCRCIKYDLFRKLPEKLQDINAFMQYGVVTPQLIDEHPEIKWDYQLVSHSEYLTSKFVIEHKNENWDWQALDYFYKEPEKSYEYPDRKLLN